MKLSERQAANIDRLGENSVLPDALKDLQQMANLTLSIRDRVDVSCGFVSVFYVVLVKKRDLRRSSLLGKREADRNYFRWTWN